MKSGHGFTRYLLMAVLALPAAGCGGCTVTDETPDWEDWGQEFRNQLYLQWLGPAALTSAVGAAAPPGRMGGLNAIAMELAWRSCLQPPAEVSADAASVASVVGAAAPAGACGGLPAASALLSRDAQREALVKRLRAPSLFEVRQPHQPKTIRREMVW
jgi:hypothetical protein